ncbi:MAG: phage protease [Phycisphaerae bacterium]
MSATQQVEQWIAILRTAIPVDAPGRIMVLPWGKVASTSGEFIVDDAAAAAIVGTFRARGLDLPIDTEHATEQIRFPEFATPDATAPARGWIKALEAVPGQGIYAQVEWTARGAEFVQSKEYRYLSPAILVRKSDGRAIELSSVALTNKPAIAAMRPIVNREKTEGAGGASPPADHGQELTMIEIRKTLGLADGADEAACVTAIQALREQAKPGKAAGELRTAICKALEVQETVGDESLLTAVRSLKAARPAGDGEDVKALRAELAAMKSAAAESATQLTALRESQTTREANERIAAAKAAGKLTDAMLVPNSAGVNHFSALARDEKAWNAWLDVQPVIAPAAGRVTQPNSTGGGTSPSDRKALIAKAVAEYRQADPVLRQVCSERSHVVTALRDAGLATQLSAEESVLVAA